jgi:hypothetical protein
MPTKENVYKEHPVLSIETDYGEFWIGWTKAKAILDNIDDIKAFVTKHENYKPPV